MSASLFRRFLRHPTQVGAVCPSSDALARMITEEAGIETAPVVVELGPGTGVFTREILRRRQDRNGGRFLAVEIDGELYRNLRREFPDLELFRENAVHLPELLKAQSLEYADVIIAGLPWAIFPEQLQTDILSAVRRSLKPGGYFLTFAYIQGILLPAGLRFRRQLHEAFSEVRTSQTVWRNLPPAFVYRCKL